MFASISCLNGIYHENMVKASSENSIKQSFLPSHKYSATAKNTMSHQVVICSSCDLPRAASDIHLCESCEQQRRIYDDDYCRVDETTNLQREADPRRFNLSYFIESILNVRNHCDNCLLDCYFCEYSTCQIHTHSINLPWFDFPLTICKECNDLHNKSFYFSHALSGKVLIDQNGGIVDEDIQDEVDGYSQNWTGICEP